LEESKFRSIDGLKKLDTGEIILVVNATQKHHRLERLKELPRDMVDINQASISLIVDHCLENLSCEDAVSLLHDYIKPQEDLLELTTQKCKVQKTEVKQEVDIGKTAKLKIVPPDEASQLDDLIKLHQSPFTDKYNTTLHFLMQIQNAHNLVLKEVH
jgi:hypothetical protein